MRRLAHYVRVQSREVCARNASGSVGAAGPSARVASSHGAAQSRFISSFINKAATLSFSLYAKEERKRRKEEEKEEKAAAVAADEEEEEGVRCSVPASSRPSLY